MSERLTLQLVNPQQARAAIQTIWQRAKGWLIAGGEGTRLEVELRPARRTLDQNARLHATLAEVARQVEWAGKRRDVTTWKRLMTAAWLRARGEQLEVLPALDGHGVDIVFERTSRLTRAECAELMEYVYAWGAQHGVRFSAAEDGL